MSFDQDSSEEDDEYDYYDEREHALFVLREDVSRQLKLTSDRQNMILQLIGILVAFASIIFVQQLIMDTDVHGWRMYAFAISLLLIFFCCTLGIYTIMMSDVFAISTGRKIERSVDRYNEGDIEGFEAYIVSGMYYAFVETHNKNEQLTKRLKQMSLMLMLGIVMLINGVI